MSTAELNKTNNPYPATATDLVATGWTADDLAIGSSDPVLVAALEQAFGQPFSVLDISEGHQQCVAAGWLHCDLFSRLGLIEEIARRGQPEVVEDCDPLLMLAVPLLVEDKPTTHVAISTFLTSAVTSQDDLIAAAKTFGVDTEKAYAWSQSSRLWPGHAVMSLTQAICQNQAQSRHIATQEHQLTDVSAHLLSTFEELSLLHRLSERLSLASSQLELCELAVEWLAEVVPGNCLAAAIKAPEGEQSPSAEIAENHVLSWGESPLADSEYPQFIERLGPEAAVNCLVLNRDRTSSPTWYYPKVTDLISVPIRSGEHVFGWLLAINNKNLDSGGEEFGTVEASLLSSVAAILGVHAGNISLYREQSDFFGSVIRALSSAIDAKDPYTCGHSDRVARISVCLARQMGCETEDLNTLYLSGLLHDIGKIGIDDNVLRKPGKLTAEEYEHIKTHPELGYKILQGVKQLDKVLPVVLHHHEAWDGGGYPGKLAGTDCPRLARIVAVADSIDAMGSDRPYRKGMPEEKLTSILREGSGKQWDPDVIDAYLAVRQEVAEIEASDRASLSLDVQQWIFANPVNQANLPDGVSRPLA